MHLGNEKLIESKEIEFINLIQESILPT